MARRSQLKLQGPGRSRTDRRVARRLRLSIRRHSLLVDRLHQLACKVQEDLVSVVSTLDPANLLTSHLRPAAENSYFKLWLLQ